jgi:hypothetical protein
MSKNRYFSGMVKEGEFIPFEYEEKPLSSHLDDLNGKPCRMLISQEFGIASWQQTKYLWAVVYKMIAVEQSGPDCSQDDVEEVHREMCRMFNYEEMKVLEPVSGETIRARVPKTISDHTTVRRMEYIEQIRRWASDFLGLYIPDPNEIMPEQLEEK